MATGTSETKLKLLKEQIRKVDSALTVCGQLNHDPNAFFTFRNELIVVERLLLELSEELGLGQFTPFALTQFSPEQIAELKLNLRHWHELVEQGLANSIPSA